MPIYNPAGKYLVKLHINGIERKVAVDDRFPLSKDGRIMTSHTTHAQELWVQIIEKAYMKVNGGYDFPGSNSGIDMFALTGWIPEQVMRLPRGMCHLAPLSPIERQPASRSLIQPHQTPSSLLNQRRGMLALTARLPPRAVPHGRKGL